MKQYWNLPQKNNKNKKVIYKNARLFDPASALDLTGSLLTIGNEIADYGAALFQDSIPEGAEIIDCNGHLLTPGLIDLQVHFREPGESHKETINSGSKSAAAGGITTVVCQPNTNPPLDNIIAVEYLKSKARSDSYINIHFYGTISKNRAGQELSEMGKLVEAGAVGFTDDGGPVMNSLLMRRALTYSSMFDVPIAQHAEDLDLSQGGCINEGEVSFKLAVAGIPNISESVMVERDLAILEYTGGRYHLLHISTHQALDAIKRAKDKGLNVTCEVAPHHFLLNDQEVLKQQSIAKMNPPLRSEEDRLAMIEGLKSNIIDAIATDHAPHDTAVKNIPLERAAFGIVGVETMLPLSLELYHQGILTLEQVISKMTSGPAAIINKPIGRIAKGMVADLTLIDLHKSWQIDVHNFSSKSHNSPFHNRPVKGRAIRTIISGETVYILGE